MPSGDGPANPAGVSGSQVCLGDNAGLRTVVSNSPDAYGLGLREGRPLWGRAVHTSVYGAHLSSVPSGDRSVFPATLGASGHSDLQQISFSASVQKRSGPERFATSEKVFRTARSAIPCRSSASGHRASSFKHTRGQSRETGSLSTFYGSVETSAKCISMGFAQSRERVQDSVRVSSASVQWGISHSGGPRAGSGNCSSGKEQVDTLMRKETTEVKVLLPLLHHSEEGWGLHPILDLRLLNRSVMRLKFKMLTIKQVVSQIRSEDWFVTIDLKDAYFHISILPQHRKFLRVALRGKSYQYRVLSFGLALSHRTFTKCVDATLALLRLQSIRILN